MLATFGFGEADLAAAAAGAAALGGASPYAPLAALPPEALSGTGHLVLLVVDGTTVRAVATDGHRLALCEVAKDGASNKIEAIIPRKTVSELQKLVDDPDVANFDDGCDIGAVERHDGVARVADPPADLGDQARHVGHALQVGAGAAVTVFDGAG